jgi:hypothetical protein
MVHLLIIKMLPPSNFVLICIQLSARFVVLLFISLSDLSAILLSSKVTSLFMCFFYILIINRRMNLGPE